MGSVDIFNMDREVVGSVELDAAVFNDETRAHLYHAVVRYQMAKRRAGTHATKGRAMVSGGGRKPYRQKGTGRARQGSTRSPHYRGGGVVHGPHFRSHAHKLPKTVRRLALAGALAKRALESRLTVLNAIDVPSGKTKDFVGFLDRFGFEDLLVVVNDDAVLVERASRNLQSVTVLPVVGVNLIDVLRHSNVAMTVDALSAVTARLRG